MIITSRIVKGHCPICGAARCTCGGPTTIEPVDRQVRDAPAGGRLVTVPLRPGVSVRMYESEARAQGLLAPEPPAEGSEKARRPAANKKRRPELNKAG